MNKRTLHRNPVTDGWKFFGLILLMIPSWVAALSIPLTVDAYRDNTISDVNSGYLSSWFDDNSPVSTGTGISIYSSQNGMNIVNYIGDLNAYGIANSQAALKFVIPSTDRVLAEAQLRLRVVDKVNNPTATIVLTDDNNWSETTNSNTSTFPHSINTVTLINAQPVTTSNWNTFSLPTSSIQSKTSTTSSSTVSFIVTGSTAINNFFTFYSDNDAKSNGGSVANNAQLVLHFRPQVQNVSVPADSVYKIGDALNFTVAFDSLVTVTGTPELSVDLATGGTVAASYVSGSGTTNLTFRYTIVAGNEDTDGISLGSLSLDGGSIKSAGGHDAETNLYNKGNTSNILVDGVAPAIGGATYPANDTYIVGQNLDFTLNFSENVTVNTSGGTPYLTLTLGSTTQQADYLSGSGTSTLTFRYTLASGDQDEDGVALSSNVTLNGATIRDDAGNNASLTFAGSTLSGVLVDAVAPSISVITPPASGTYILGDTLVFTSLFSEDVTVTGVPSIAITIGSNTRQALYTAGSGSAELTFRYALQEGDSADAIAVAGAIALNGGSIADGAGNAATSLSFAPPSTSGIVIDALSPEITSITPPASGTYILGDTLVFTSLFSENVTVTGTPSIAITIGSNTRQALYTAGSGSAELTFRYALQEGDSADAIAVAGAIALNGGSIADGAGNAATSLSFAPPSTSGIVIDVKSPEIASITPPASGTYSLGDTLEFTALFSEDVTVTGVPSIAITIGTTPVRRCTLRVRVLRN